VPGASAAPFDLDPEAEPAEEQGAPTEEDRGTHQERDPPGPWPWDRRSGPASGGDPELQPGSRGRSQRHPRPLVGRRPDPVLGGLHPAYARAA